MTSTGSFQSGTAAVLEPRTSPASPPVLILNMFYSGLGIARQLAGKGMRVVGLSSQPSIYGNFTRLCEIRRAPDSKDSPEQLLEFLRNTDEFDGAVIFPTRDADVIFLDRHRSQLGRYCLSIPPAQCLRSAIDKYELARIAQHAGVPVPRTLAVRSAEELTRVPGEVGFPCVVKPISAYQWHVGDVWERVGCRKAFRVDNWNSLQSEYEQIAQVTPEVLIQEWIHGPVDQIVILGGYVGDDSELLGYFTARKILQFPEDCGTGCIVRSEPIDEIVETTAELFRALQYQGMAEVEYKYDARTREYKLIEINTRHWDQHQLAEASSVNLSWIAYCHLTGKVIPRQHGPVAVATWVAEDALFTKLIRSLVRPQLRTPHLLAKLSGPRMYGIFSATDPVPFVRYFGGTVLPELTGKMFRGIRDSLRSRS